MDEQRYIATPSVIDLEMTRFRVEQKHFENLKRGYGHKQKKSPFQLQVLESYFARNPIWDYPTKIKICEELGMTMAQIQKWNWDQRQRNGLGKKNKRVMRPYVYLSKLA